MKVSFGNIPLTLVEREEVRKAEAVLTKIEEKYKKEPFLEMDIKFKVRNEVDYCQITAYYCGFTYASRISIEEKNRFKPIEWLACQDAFIEGLRSFAKAAVDSNKFKIICMPPEKKPSIFEFIGEKLKEHIHL